MHPEYVDYNHAVVVLDGTYTITNVQTKGIPPENCEAHLESLEIESAVVGQSNTENLGASGTITLIDYRDSVFNVLRKKLHDYVSSNKQDKSLLPTVSIQIDCFTGSDYWEGTIIDWQMQFVGTTPSLTLTWTGVTPSSFNSEAFNKLNGTTYKTPSNLFSDIQSIDFKPKFQIVDKDGNDVGNSLKFIKEEGLTINLSGLNATANKQLDLYDYIIRNCVHSSGANLLVVGRVDKASKKYIVEFRDPSKNISNDSKLSKFIFVQNGVDAYYKVRNSDKLLVIPMTSFTYSTKMNNLVLESRILNNPNGNVVLNTSGEQSHQQQLPDAPSSENQSQIAKDPKNSATTVTFECYNVVNFSLNNTNEQIMYEIYNEFGQRHIVSGKGTVTACTLSLSNGVVKASVTCTEVFNDSKSTEDGSAAVSDDSGFVAGTKSLNQLEETSSSTTNKTGPLSKEQQIDNLSKEDENPIDLSKDETYACLQDGRFSRHLSKFFDDYFYMTGSDRELTFGFVKMLVEEGDFGLFTLLLAVANYGIIGAYAEEMAEHVHDPVKDNKDFVNAKPFCASAFGKAPTDYKKGGLSIPHWDDSNFKEIYTTCGFSPTIDRDHFSKLIIQKPPQNKSHYTGVVSSWKDIVYSGVNRIIPVFTNKPYMRTFDNGLKSDANWLDWAKEIIFYRDSNNKLIYQEYLFKYWIEDFWLKTVKALKSKKSTSDHKICLQDAIRIARAANSEKRYLTLLPGKTVEEQCELYYSSKATDRRIRQLQFCSRACKVAEFILKYHLGQ